MTTSSHYTSSKISNIYNQDLSNLAIDTPPIYIVFLLNIKVIVLLVFIAGFLLKNSLAISYTTNIMLPTDWQRTRPDVEKERIGSANVEKTRQEKEEGKTRSTDVEEIKANIGEEGIKPEDVNELVDLGKLANPEN